MSAYDGITVGSHGRRLLAEIEQKKEGRAKTLAQAILDMTEARESHERWAEHLEAGGCACCTSEVVATVGDAATHREWVRKYDRVLALLLTGPLTPEEEGMTGARSHLRKVAAEVRSWPSFMRVTSSAAKKARCRNGCEVDAENPREADGYCRACHEYPEGG